MTWAKPQKTEQTWKTYKNGEYFKMLHCPSCKVPVHEKYFGKSHSGIGEDIGWAIHDDHKCPPAHFHLGDLGTSTTSLSGLAEALLTDQQAKGNLVRKIHGDADVRNIDDS